MSTALLWYAEEHGQKFPDTLEEMPLNAVHPAARRFHDPVTKEESDWIYYGGNVPAAAYNDQSPVRVIVLASPRMVQDRQRIVGYADGSVVLEREDNFVFQLSAQLKNQRGTPRNE